MQVKHEHFVLMLKLYFKFKKSTEVYMQIEPRMLGIIYHVITQDSDSRESALNCFPNGFEQI